MLWDSLIAGLQILQFWQTYVVAAGMTIIVAFPKLYLALLEDRFMYGEAALSPTLVWYLIRHHWVDGFEKLKDRAYKNRLAGGLKGLLVVGVAEFLGGYFATLTLLPLMLSTGTHANWALPWILPFQDVVLFVKIVGALLLMSILVLQLPILGEMLVYPLSVSVAAYFFGVTQSILIPDFWLACIFVLAGVAVKHAVIRISAIIVALMPVDVVFSGFAKVASMLFFLVLPVLNLLPAFFYAGWVSQQL